MFQVTFHTAEAVGFLLLRGLLPSSDSLTFSPQAFMRYLTTLVC